MGDKNNLYSFQPKKGPALARVRLSDNFCEQTGIWGGEDCLLRRFDGQNPDIAIVEIPGREFPVRVHCQDFDIVG